MQKCKKREAQKITIIKMIGSNPKTGLTLPEIALRLNCQLNACSGRLTELLKAGLIYRTPDKRKNPSTGVNCSIYKVSGK